MADDFAALQARIADDLERTDLDSQIEAAIRASIEFYADTEFWFLEGDGSVETVAGQAWVAVPEGLRHAEACDVEIDLGSEIRGLRKTGWTTHRRMMRLGTSSGEPTHYAYRAGRFWFWPVPDKAYTVTAWGIYDQPALSAGTDSNAWTSTARELIAADVRMRIARDVLRDPEAERNAARAAEIAHAELLRKGNKRRATGRIRPHL